MGNPETPERVMGLVAPDNASGGGNGVCTTSNEVSGQWCQSQQAPEADC